MNGLSNVSIPTINSHGIVGEYPLVINLRGLGDKCWTREVQLEVLRCITEFYSYCMKPCTNTKESKCAFYYSSDGGISITPADGDEEVEQKHINRAAQLAFDDVIRDIFDKMKYNQNR